MSSLNMGAACFPPDAFPFLGLRTMIAATYSGLDAGTIPTKIALCLSGLIRDIDYTKPFWINLINKYDIDVYGSFWDDENKENGDTIDNLKSIFNFNSCAFSKSKSLMFFLSSFL